MIKQDIHRTPKNERTQLEQDFRDKAANNFHTSRKCDNTYSEALYYGQYIANKYAAMSVRTSHRYGLMHNMTKEHYDIVSETREESYSNRVMRGYEALEEISKDLP
tara:strand:- start:685 stop:1002 length:318 start_codon:yes stop_codon:yes gene_type:complete